MKTERAVAALGERDRSSVRGRRVHGAERLSGRIQVVLGFTVCLWSWQAVILPASGAAQCVGDCDGGGTVTVNELIEGVTIALGDRPVGDCSSFDTNGDQRITVDELIRAVNAALIGCVRPMRDEVVRASSDAALMAPSTVNQVAQIMDFGVIGAPGGLRSRTATPQRSLRVLGDGATARGPAGQVLAEGGGAQQPLPCAAGGTAETSCSTDNAGNFTLDAFYTDCTFFTQSESQVVLNGSIQQTAATEGVCSGMTSASDSVTFRYIDFDSVQTDVDGTVTFRSASQLLDIFKPSGQGCDGLNSGQGFDGDLFVEIDAPTGEPVYAVDLFATQFILATNASGSPCRVGVGLDGVLDVTDELTSQDSTLDFSSFFVFTTFGADGSSDVELTGGINSACVGTLQITTRQLLHFDTPDALCPSAGVLQVTLPDQSVGDIQFSLNGLDFNGDGRADVSSCLDPSIQQCPGECMPCQVDEDCPGSQGCFSCGANCTQQQAVDRCAPVDRSVQCTDGTF